MDAAPARRPLWSLWIVLVVWLGIAAVYLFEMHGFNGPDAYYHVRIAEIMRSHGLFLHQFPYATESTWADQFFDKEWLFHVFLIPFLFFGLTVGPKLAVLALNGIIILAVWQALRALKVSNPIPWLLVLPFCGYSDFWYRLTLVRPHLGSIAILFFCLAAMVQRRHVLLGFLSLVYALAYTGHWQLLGIVLVYDVLYVGLEENGQRRPALCRKLPMIVATAVGMLIGEMVHPQFPANLSGLFMQNVMVLKDYWQGNVSPALIDSRPSEIRPYALSSFLLQHALVLAGLAAVAIHAWVRRSRLARREWMLLAYTVLYLFMASRSQRFTEYLVAMAVVLVAVYWDRRHLEPAMRHRWVRVLCGGALAAFMTLGVVARYNQLAADRHRLGNKHPYAGAAAWLDQNLAPGDIVFATSWSDNPYLFYGAPRQRYLVFLDPYFMYARSPERFELWNAVRYGRVSDPIGVIRNDFHARAVFTQPFPGFAGLIEALDHAPGVSMTYIGPAGERIYMLPDRWPLPAAATP